MAAPAAGKVETMETCPNCTWRGEVELVDEICPQCGGDFGKVETMNIDQWISKVHEEHLRDHTAADFEVCKNPACQMARAAELEITTLRDKCHHDADMLRADGEVLILALRYLGLDESGCDIQEIPAQIQRLSQRVAKLEAERKAFVVLVEDIWDDPDITDGWDGFNALVEFMAPDEKQ